MSIGACADLGEEQGWCDSPPGTWCCFQCPWLGYPELQHIPSVALDWMSSAEAGIITWEKKISTQVYCNGYQPVKFKWMRFLHPSDLKTNIFSYSINATWVSHCRMMSIHTIDCLCIYFVENSNSILAVAFLSQCRPRNNLVSSVYITCSTSHAVVININILKNTI